MNKHGQRSRKHSAAAATCAGGLAATLLLAWAGQPLTAATVTWDAGAGDGLWASNSNWSSDAVGVVSGDTAVFADTGTGSTSVMNETSPFTVGKLIYQNTAGTHTLDLNGNQLNLSALDAGYETQTSTAVIQNGSVQLAGDYRIGYAAFPAVVQNTTGSVSLNNVAVSSGNIGSVWVGYTMVSANPGDDVASDTAAGTWDMSGSHNGVFNNQGGGEFKVGGTRIGTATPLPDNGVVRFGNNWDIDIGTAASPTEFRVGYAGNGTVTAGTGGSFTGYFSNFVFGKQGNATLDLSGIDNGYISLSAAGGFVGDGNGATGYTADLALGRNWTLQFNGGIAGFGYNGATTTVTAPNLTLTGTLTRLYVGTAPSGSGIGGQADVTVGGLGSGLTTSALWVGSHHASAVGHLTLPAGDFTLTGEMYLGSTGTGSLTLNGTNMRMTVLSGTPLRIGAGGRTSVLVGGEPCGPIIDFNSKYAVSIDSLVTGGGGLMLDFTRIPAHFGDVGTAAVHDDIFYGLKWAGDRTSTTDSRELGYLVNNHYVGWDDSRLYGLFTDAVSLFYDAGTNATYIGFYVLIPEPATAGLLALAALMLPRRWPRGRV